MYGLFQCMFQCFNVKLIHISPSRLGHNVRRASMCHVPRAHRGRGHVVRADVPAPAAAASPAGGGYTGHAARQQRQDGGPGDIPTGYVATCEVWR